MNDPLYNHTVFGPEKGKGGNIGKSDEKLIADLISIHNAENWLGMDGDSELSMFNKGDEAAGIDDIANKLLDREQLSNKNEGNLPQFLITRTSNFLSFYGTKISPTSSLIWEKLHIVRASCRNIAVKSCNLGRQGFISSINMEYKIQTFNVIWRWEVMPRNNKFTLLLP